MTTAEQVALYVQCVFDPEDFIENRNIYPGELPRPEGLKKVVSIPLPARQLAEHCESMVKLNRQGYGIYAGANPRKHFGGTKAEDIAHAWCLFADFDEVASVDDVRVIIRRAGLPEPTMIIASGHGVHVYWRLTEPICDMALWTRMQKGIIRLLGSDNIVHDAPRVMRLPGFTNTKPPAPTPCEIVKADPMCRYQLDEILSVLPMEVADNKPEKAEKQIATGTPRRCGPGTRYGLAALRAETESVRKATPHKDRNSQLNKSAFVLGQLVASGDLDQATVEAELRAAAEQTGLSSDEVLRTIASGLPKGMAKPRPPKTRKNDDSCVVEDPTPISIAETFLEEWTDPEGELKIRRYRGDWMAFKDGGYRTLSDEQFRAKLYRHCEVLWVRTNDGLKKLNVNRRLIGEVADAMPSRDGVLLPDDRDAPFWLDERPGLDPRELVGCRNGLLHLPTGQLIPSTPKLFSTSTTDFDYAPEAPKPTKWFSFLRALWPDDDESVTLLWQWFGYCLAADTTLQKMLMIVGPRRGGKGTIARVLTSLVGPSNVAGPTLAGLCTNFGLSALINKMVGIVADARLSGRTDQAIIAERLLSLSGEDLLTIDRKHRDSVAVRLPTRLMLLSNELPRVQDTSGALASRFLILQTTQSWLGRENTRLEEELRAELPGIFNWAVDGWRHLRASGRFAEPASSREVAEDLAALSSPVGVFLGDRCNVGPKYCVEIRRLYDAWRSWCDENGRQQPGTSQSFGRDLRAAIPALHVSQHRSDDGILRIYKGVELR